MSIKLSGFETLISLILRFISASRLVFRSHEAGRVANLKRWMCFSFQQSLGLTARQTHLFKSADKNEAAQDQSFYLPTPAAQSASSLSSFLSIVNGIHKSLNVIAHGLSQIVKKFYFRGLNNNGVRMKASIDLAS